MSIALPQKNRHYGGRRPVPGGAKREKFGKRSVCRRKKGRKAAEESRHSPTMDIALQEPLQPQFKLAFGRFLRLRGGFPDGDVQGSL